MLLNPSHKVTLSGLPPDVLDAYVRYKKGTRALVTWFIQYSPSPNRQVKKLPIKELESLAQIVSKKLRSLPDIVHFHFRETIAARTRLSKYFRHIDESADDEVTVNHEHFTTSLARIYDDLCACCGRPDTKSQPHSGRSRSSSLSDGLVNQYNGLSVEECQEYEDEESTSPISQGCPECTATSPPNCGGSGLDAHFADDELGTMLEVAAAVQRIQGISSSVEHCWHLAGKGNLSFTVASFVTNVAFASLRQVGIELLGRDENLALSVLHQMFCSFNRSGTVEAPSPNGNSESTNHLLLDQLQKIEQCLLHYRDRHPSSLVKASSASSTQKSNEYLQGSSIHDDTIIHHFISNILDLVTSKAIPTTIVRNSTPIYADLGYFVTHPDEQTQSWSAVLGLNLLITSSIAYHKSIGTSNAGSKCRLVALRLAQQASSQVKAMISDKICFPCRCSQTLAYHLQNLEEDLYSYARYKCWDLYFQSPWVAGNHALEILDLCHYYGIRLLNYRHYVGAVLHSYNVLKQLGGLAEIPILEKLCEQFRSVFFPGGNQPEANFRACWSRYIGARLKFNSKKGHKKRNSRDGWCMVVPPHAARRAAGLSLGLRNGDDEQQQEKHDCILYRIKQQDYHLSNGLWNSLDTSASPQSETKNSKKGRSSSTTSRSFESSKSKSSDSDTYFDRLLHLAHTVQRSVVSTPTQSDSDSDSEPDNSAPPAIAIEGDEVPDSHTDVSLPSARINLFTVFSKCALVVSRLSDSTHTSDTEKGINCICFASALLTGADRIVDNKKWGRVDSWKKSERECVNETKKAIKELFESVKEEEWVWNI
ncbi:uncharacterized protein Z518_04520 [Rhinocladiella mackenziei CBS 650.93]|uniref:DUF6604 domain-containing protein n=1 Tax=Rhinocladiella mackenziei CBS 650.93 TaxID=1442369 RepID=A0A0D2ILF8_9EURO|nr:uncharacterized protein Z518_04520 [Rhinocladiella mackenziei CBS 650.93]KIX06544.1 hypothetical protein Z518_04520 [Rhinocladiella mackenziei CBS 650.93]